MTTEPTTEQSTTSLAEAMEAAFAEIVGMPAPAEKGEGTVIWYLKAAQRLDKQFRDLDSSWDAMSDEIDRWLGCRAKVITDRQNWLDETYLPTVEAVTKAKIAHTGKKSFKWPYGECSFKKQPDKVDVVDEAAALDWCELNLPSAIRVKTTRSIDKKRINAHFIETGEWPPGVTVTPGKDVFYVKAEPLATLPASEQPPLLGTDQQTKQGAHE